MTPSEIKDQISNYISSGKKVFTTSSFQSQSLVLLKLISEMEEVIPVYFINTGYHFPDTLNYKNMIADLLGLTVYDIESPIPKSMQKDTKDRLLYSSDTDTCCAINKVEPMEIILSQYDVWVNGVRKSQTSNRATMEYVEKTKHNAIRFHPLLEWIDSMVETFIEENKLPKHPLEKLGYKSIGCEPCTRIPLLGEFINTRGQRWFGQTKTECGLHLELRDNS